MKQNITEEQFEELTIEQKRILYEYNKNRYSHFGRGDYCHLSIGQMIEFLIEYLKKQQLKVPQHQHKGLSIQTFGDGKDFKGIWNIGMFDRWSICSINDDYHNKAKWYVNNENLCDALWKTIKEILKYD